MSVVFACVSLLRDSPVVLRKVQTAQSFRWDICAGMTVAGQPTLAGRGPTLTQNSETLGNLPGSGLQAVLILPDPWPGDYTCKNVALKATYNVMLGGNKEVWRRGG